MFPLDRTSAHMGSGRSRRQVRRHIPASQITKPGVTNQQIGRLLCHVGQTVTSCYVHQEIEALQHFAGEHGERVRTAVGGTTPAQDEETPALRV